ncbi:MAG: ribonuclease Z [Nanoarchaeota archaeon]|nr:ribonuclease Z [Nanoarchaeota archaeon]
MIEIVFLGTSSMVPTKERNHSSVLVSFKGNNILMDCGEGTQRQLKIAGISASKINKILISHWHGDHVLGLPGLIQTLAANKYEKTLEIYGPKGTKKRFKAMFEAFVFDNNIDLKVVDVEKGVFFENSDFKIEALPLEHGIATLGFSFIEKDRRRIELSKAKKLGLKEGPLLGKLQDGKSITFNGKKIKPDMVCYVVEGKKITYIADTLQCKNAYKLAENSDLMICEATYASAMGEKVEERFHMSAKQAGLIANKANVNELILTHLSARYKDDSEVLEDAKDVFNNVRVAHDFMKIKL